MTYVIAEPCVATCDQACLDVCPVDCIHGPIPNEEIAAVPKSERHVRLPVMQLFIEPEACIHCGACEPECPVSAIFEEDRLPPKWAHYRELNRAFFEARRAATSERGGG
jgi:NAD-dependent dihydropyrimidine dehydrogenase PreA subunit